MGRCLAQFKHMPRKKIMGRAANSNSTIRKKTVTRNGTEYTSREGRVTLDVYGYVSERMKDESTARMQAYINGIQSA